MKYGKRLASYLFEIYPEAESLKYLDYEEQFIYHDKEVIDE